MQNLQLFLGEKPGKHLFKLVVNRNWAKLSGGLWTSTHNNEIGSGWVDWCKDEMPHWLDTQF